MANLFDRQDQKVITVQVGDTFFRGDEVVAYFDEVLNGLLSQDKSLHNKMQFINMAKILIKKRENRKASGVVFQALSRYPGDPEFMGMKSEIFVRLKNYESALETLDEALERNPYNIDLLMKKARVFSLIHDEDKEEQLYLQILDIPRNDFMTNRNKLIAMHRLGDLYIKEKRFGDAEQLVDKVIKSHPDEATFAMYSTILSKLGKEAELKQMRESFARYKKARDYFEKGTRYEADAKFDLARKYYEEGLNIYPDEPLVNMKVGSILLYKKNWPSKAEQFIRKSVELDPQQASFRSNLVIALQKQGKYEEAFEQAKIAEQQDPLSNLNVLSCLALELNKGDEFIAIIKKAIEEDPHGTIPALRYELANYYKNVDDQEKAEEWYSKAVELYVYKIDSFPDDWETYLDLGHCFVNLKKYEQAEGAYKIAEQIKTTNKEEVYEALVSLYQKTHEKEKVSQYLKKLIKINPKKMVNYIDLGINYLSQLTNKMRKSDNNT
ncbi:MAG: tetratricopeptide repeat protein [Vulcanimicrobiota bacterium]